MARKGEKKVLPSENVALKGEKTLLPSETVTRKGETALIEPITPKTLIPRQKHRSQLRMSEHVGHKVKNATTERKHLLMSEDVSI